MHPLKLVHRIEIWPIHRIIAYAKNPRRHSKTQVAQIVASMRAYGVVNPVLIDKQGNLIAGHGRLLAAMQIGLTQLPVIILDHLTEAQARSLRIADNKIGEKSTWHDEYLSEELAALLEEKIDLTTLGFGELELKHLLAELEQLVHEDDVPEPPPNPVTQLGDLWDLSADGLDHREYCGDSTRVESLQQVMDGHMADMIFADLPYNVALGSSRPADAGPQRPILNDDLGEDFANFLAASCAAMLAVSGGAIYLCMSSSELHTLHHAFTEAGGHWSTFIIWVKNTFTLGHSDFQRQYEPILFGWGTGSKHYWSGARNVGDVWFVDKPIKNDLHPTMKPVELVEKAILLSSRRGDLVLDPFSGVGATLIACHKAGRRARLVELDPHYVDITIKRWQAYSGGVARLVSSGRTFDEVAQERNGFDPNEGAARS